MSDEANLAVFCDFENIALGARDAKIAPFEIRPVLDRLLLKGAIVARKAYCDWERYKEFKAPMHEAAFELIEIPHVRQSGKNSADIRLVVDALDLCYTKEHIDTFVIISGDSDFSPLVSKLRENAKTVIGVGVKSSTSDLLTNTCDEFIYYDDLVRRGRPKKRAAGSKAKTRDSRKDKSKDALQVDDPEGLRTAGIDLVLDTAEALYEERGDLGKVWGSMVKQTLKRTRPGFNESFHGFRTFGELLEEAEKRGEVELERDDKSGGYIINAIKRTG